MKLKTYKNLKPYLCKSVLDIDNHITYNFLCGRLAHRMLLLIYLFVYLFIYCSNKTQTEVLRTQVRPDWGHEHEQHIPCPWDAVALTTRPLEIYKYTRFFPTCTTYYGTLAHQILLHSHIYNFQYGSYPLGKTATIHQLITMLSTSKNVLNPGHNHLLTTDASERSSALVVGRRL